MDPLQRPDFLWGFSAFSNQTHILQKYLCCGEGKLSAQNVSYEHDFEKDVWTVVNNQLNMRSQD